MKRIMMIMAFALFALGANAQDRFTVIPKGRFEYVTSPTGWTITPDAPIAGTEFTKTYYYNTKDQLVAYNEKEGVIEDYPVIRLGRFRTDMGIEFAWKGVAFLFDTEVYMGGKWNGVKDAGFRPVQTNFHFTLQYSPKVVKGMKIYISHSCYHPIQQWKGDTANLTGYHGGVTKVGVSYNY